MEERSNTPLQQYKVLSIQINLSGLSFCIYNELTEVVEYLEEELFFTLKNPETLLDAVKTAFETKPVLQSEFKSITVIHNNNWSTLVPEALFDIENITHYLKFNTKIIKSDFIAHEHIKSIDAVSVYIPFVNVNNYLFDKFGTFTYKHSTTLLVETLQVKETHNKQPIAYVNFNKKHLDIIVFKDGKLELCNSFEYRSAQDALYYILFTFEQLELNPDSTELTLFGHILEESELYKLLYTYVRNLNFGSSTKKTLHPEVTIKPHEHLTLLNSF